MCCACRQRKEKDMLVRFVVNEEQVILDSNYKKLGRGAYICKDVDCFKKAKKAKSLNRIFKCHLSEKDYDNFMNQLFGNVIGACE